VEKVVSPPRKPVVKARRPAGGKASKAGNPPMARPMSRPPTRFDASVPMGMAGKTALKARPRPHRSTAPAKAPKPTAKNEIQLTPASGS